MELVREISGQATAWAVAGVLLVYVGGRVLLGALVDLKQATAGQLGRATALPIGLGALLAVVMGRSDAAVALLLATAVGGLTLVTGLTAAVEPASTVPVMWRRVWVFLIPTAMLALLAGFAGQLTPTHALVLAAQGGLVLLVAEMSESEIDQELVPVLPGGAWDANPRPRWLQGVEAGLAGAVLLVGSWLLLDAAPQPGSVLARLSDGLLATGVWSPVLLLPLVGAAAVLAQGGRTTTVVGGAVVLALINLCVLLPLAIVAWYAWSVVQAGMSGGDAMATAREMLLGSARGMGFPMSSWRLDSVLFLVLAVALLPVALGRWTLGRREGVALVVVYALYLVGSAIVGTRY